MNSDKIQKIFLKNLPSKYSIDKLVALIEDKTNCSPNIGIIKNKKNPNNGLVIITPLSKENEAIIKQNLYHKRSKISTHSGSSINYEFLPNTIFMHNIPYHANYYDIESLMKPYIEIKELILFLDRFNRFKGSAKIILRKEEEYEKS
ncbi:RNA-binding protein [Anaeramoeba flamelloides]|uniref:RNA-binding protein n=1 Tax=Anaeramoeba flamelloides TaxID=1746091 RepID=A0AAV7YLV2_9EUKA|nr:RNA-binding protein [Anaeramoeba flamelloides]